MSTAFDRLEKTQKTVEDKPMEYPPHANPLALAILKKAQTFRLNSLIKNPDHGSDQDLDIYKLINASVNILTLENDPELLILPENQARLARLIALLEAHKDDWQTTLT